MAQERTGGRLPPHNAEAEQSVLGCMLLDAESVAIALERLKDEDFYRPQHQEIFRALRGRPTGRPGHGGGRALPPRLCRGGRGA